jgi:ABC-type amino acid transport substrate-binding protein|tara:strand:+ start:678 stop:1559 length:882 start_codon:yes stop_codon:yes gene_type:complete
MGRSLKFLTTVLLISGAFSLVSQVTAASESKAIRAVFRHYPPSIANCCGADEKFVPDWVHGPELDYIFSGPWRDLIIEVFDRFGEAVTWKRASFGNSLNQLKTGDIDVVPLVYFLDSRNAYSWFVGPIEVNKAQVSFLLNKKIHGDISKIEDLFSLILANEQNSATAPAIDDNPKIKIDRFPSRQDALDAVRSRKADVLIDTNLKRLLDMKHDSRAIELTIATFHYTYTSRPYLALSRKNFDKADAIKLDQIVEDMFRDGTVKLIYKSYGLKTPPYQRSFSKLRPEKNSTADN